MDNPSSPQPSKSASVRAEFDKILMHHVSSLIDTREDIAALPFNLATIACLLLAAERENEIKSFPNSPTERYNRETFLADIEEIGLDLDEDARQAIQLLEHYGFVVINDEDQYTARESASLLIMVLDAIFPNMPGMNLVAYVSQAIEEVLTGRKEQERALEQFDQTLKKQGVRLSAIPEDKLASSATKRILAQDTPDPEILLARRAAYLQRLQALRAKSLSSDATPSVVGSGAQLKHAEITELFPRKDSATETDGQPEEITPGDTVDIPESDIFPEHPVPDTGLPEAERDLLQSTPEGLPEPGEETAVTHLEGHAGEMQTGMGSVEDVFPDEFENVEMSIQETEDVEEPLSKEQLIEQKIRQFEEELAMPCPICEIGKVLSDTTEKGKTYYHCSNEDCRLISWGKPYHMECPICKNPFLIEVPEPDGQIGLKCPRATCLYRKKSTIASLAGRESTSGKRRVAVVKKKRKKGVRRVVRRKS